MHAHLVIGTVVSVIVLITGMITAFALQTSEHRIAPQEEVDSSELTRKACSVPVEQIGNPI